MTKRDFVLIAAESLNAKAPAPGGGTLMQYVVLIQDDKDEGQIGVGIYPAPGPTYTP